jgi:hypothetical protein
MVESLDVSLKKSLENLNFRLRDLRIKKLATIEHKKIEIPEERKMPIAPRTERGMRAGIRTASRAF